MSLALGPMVCPACGERYPAGAFCATDGTPLVRAAGSGREGQVLADRYRLTRLLGQGGMGQVYAADHLNIAKKFAIKLLRPEILASPEAVVRFRQEAWTASSIGHENIIGIDDFATLPDGTVYLAMELLEGESLAERMKRESIPPADARDLMRQVCRGLAAAHEKGIVHRDLKPENLFLVARTPPLVKILDFGIAKVFGGTEPSVQTRTGQIVGTPQYMSPEQACGKAAGPSTDVYSLGVIMYEVFAGRVPFLGDSALEVLTQHLSKSPPVPSSVAPERAIPPDLDRLILAMMAKEPGERPGIARVEQVLAGQAEAPALAVAAAAPSTAPAFAAGATPTGSTAAASPSPVTPPEKSRRGWLVPAIALAGLAAVAVVAWLALRSPSSAPAPSLAGTSSPAMVAPSTSAAPPLMAQSAERPATTTVLVDSIPVRAQILLDGKPIGVTPEALQVPAGTVENVVLRKDGFADHPLMVDPAQSTKLVVKLQRAEAPRAPHAANPPAHAAREPSASAAREPSASAAEAKPEPPAVRVEPAAAHPAHPAARDALTDRIDAEARTVAPGSRRVHTFQGGGPRTDWFVQLDGGRCYTFVGTVEAGGLYMYLWGPGGRRLVDHRARQQTGAMNFCTQFPGSYHLQGKLAGGGGTYKLGVYTR